MTDCQHPTCSGCSADYGECDCLNTTCPMCECCGFHCSCEITDDWLDKFFEKIKLTPKQKADCGRVVARVAARLKSQRNSKE